MVVLDGAWIKHFVPQQVGAVRLRVRAPGGLRPPDHVGQDHEAHPAHGRGRVGAGVAARQVPAAAGHAALGRALVAALALVAAGAEAGPGLRRVMSTGGLLSVGSHWRRTLAVTEPSSSTRRYTVYIVSDACLEDRAARATTISGPAAFEAPAQSAGSLAFVLILKTCRVAAPRRPDRSENKRTASPLS